MHTPSPEIIADLRAALDAARKTLRDHHLKEPGLRTSAVYTEKLDALISRHAEETAQRLGLIGLSERIALLAVGGYGRRELAYLSDIDFVFVTEHTPTADDEEYMKAFLYPLWDLKLDLGYGVHSVRDCLNALGNDLEKTTSLIETRYLWGDPQLAEELQDRVQARLQKNYVPWFIESLRDEMHQRHRGFGDTVFLLEPDVKNSRGGLRDMHLILWFTFALYGEATLEVLLRNGVISPSEHERLLAAWSFFIDVRNALHLHLNRRQDKLTVERQINLAAELGAERTEFALPEESLMRRYYDHASIVERISTRLLNRALERTPGTAEYMAEAMEPRQLDRDFWGKGTRIWIEPRDLSLIKSERFWQLRMFSAAARERLEPSEDSIRSVEDRIDLVDDNYRKSPIARELFLGILRIVGGTTMTLRAMHRSGFLSAYLPEFAVVKNLPRIDYYHRYTVDEHLIRSVGVCEQLLTPNPPPLMEDVAIVARQILRIDLLMLALLIHDVGKGEGRGHVIRGLHAAQRIAERMNLRPIEQEVLRRLVAHHQKMSQMALRRDIDDPSIAKELAETVGDPEMLRMLYVHTACDMRAVSDESWNEWRGRLLGTLFERAMQELRGARWDQQQRQPTHAANTETWTALMEIAADRSIDRADFDHFFADMPPRYLRSVPAKDAARHYLLARQLSNERQIIYNLDEYEDSTYVELTFVARAQPGIFSQLCSALASKRLNILSAQIYTAFSGEAVDIFQVEVPTALRPDLRNTLDKLIDKLSQWLRTGQKPKWSQTIDSTASLVTPDRLNLRPPRVDINNETSPTHTVVEVRAPDRPGLLSEVASIFDEQGLNIDLAFIATESYQIVDVFYVTDLEANKLQPGTEMQRLITALEKVVHTPGGK